MYFFVNARINFTVFANMGVTLLDPLVAHFIWRSRYGSLVATAIVPSVPRLQGCSSYL
jgi:hypothetical protein